MVEGETFPGHVLYVVYGQFEQEGSGGGCGLEAGRGDLKGEDPRR